jgi:steroid delta-isomerase-like uncharacterized protein
MPVEENIQLMQRWFHEVWNEGQTQTIYDLIAPNGVAKGHRGGESEIRGPEEFAKFVHELRTAFPDMELKVEDIFGAADKVVVRWSANMTHTGDALGLAATGKPVRTGGISIVRIAEGKLVEGWDSWDQLGMLRQIGAYPQPDAVVLEKTA